MSKATDLWFKHFNYPLFIPEPNRGILTVLAEKGPAEMLSEVERQSALGSGWASSTLGYLSLLPAADGKRDPQHAIDLCAKPAADGDPYALYLTGWARYLLTNDAGKGAPAMLQASTQQFAPAMLGMAFFVAAANIEMALRFAGKAGKLNHKAAWVYRCAVLRRRKVGILRKIQGYVCTPMATLRYLLAIWRDPFSVNVLFLSLTDRWPAMKTVPTRLWPPNSTS